MAWLDGRQDGRLVARRQAREVNRHVEGYLAGRKRLPRRPPEWCSPGDDNEAIHCATYLADAWRRHDGAVAWLDGRQA